MTTWPESERNITRSVNQIKSKNRWSRIPSFAKIIIRIRKCEQKSINASTNAKPLTFRIVWYGVWRNADIDIQRSQSFIGFNLKTISCTNKKNVLYKKSGTDKYDQCIHIKNQNNREGKKKLLTLGFWDVKEMVRSECFFRDSFSTQKGINQSDTILQTKSNQSRHWTTRMSVRGGMITSHKRTRALFPRTSAGVFWTSATGA